MANLMCFSAASAYLCGSLRLKGLLTQRTQRYAEGRRGKTSIPTRFFVQSQLTKLAPGMTFDTITAAVLYFSHP